MESDLKAVDAWLEDKATEKDRLLLKRLFQESLKGKHKIEASHKPETDLPVVFDEGHLFFERLHILENQVFSLAENLLKTTPSLSFSTPNLSGYNLSHEQADAVREAFKHSLFFLSGGPGTGKTHTAAVILKAMKEQFPNLLIGISAPTGKAVSQLKKSLLKYLSEEDFVAKTLHAFLEVFKNETPILPYDILLVDEGSMIDLEIMARLFSALKPKGRLILMGDPWQLPPVEAGALFKPLLEKHPGKCLSKCMRTDLESIVHMAEMIKRKDKEGFFDFLRTETPGITWIPNDNLDFKLGNATLLTPLKMGSKGSQEINQAIRKEASKPFPIMITRNDPSLDLYNGDIGLLLEKEIHPGTKAAFGDRLIPSILLPAWEYAWALSIHKSQGSEFDHVHILLPDEASDISPEMLYTAVTRAKKSVVIHASIETLQKIFE